MRSHVWAKSSGLILIPGRESGERHNVVSAGGPSREPHRRRTGGELCPGIRAGSARNYYRPSGTRPSISIGSRSRAIRNRPRPSRAARARARHSIRKLLTPRCPLKNEHARVSVIEMQSDPSNPTIRERADRTFFPHRGIDWSPELLTNTSINYRHV